MDLRQFMQDLDNTSNASPKKEKEEARKNVPLTCTLTPNEKDIVQNEFNI